MVLLFTECGPPPLSLKRKSPLPVLPLTVLFVMTSDPRENWAAPPLDAEFPLIVLLRTVTCGPRLLIPPPLPAVLPRIVVALSVTVPTKSLKIPPPELPPLFPLTVLLTTTSVPPLLAMPPPAAAPQQCVEALLRTTLLVRVSRPLGIVPPSVLGTPSRMPPPLLLTKSMPTV